MPEPQAYSGFIGARVKRQQWRPHGSHPGPRSVLVARPLPPPRANLTRLNLFPHAGIGARGIILGGGRSELQIHDHNWKARLI